MQNKSSQISLAIVCLVLGVMLAIQFKTTESIGEEFLPPRVEDLTQKLIKITEERDALSEEVLALREKLENVRQNDQAMADLQDELQKVSMAAGTIAVEGPGIVITLNDSTRSLKAGENPNALLVHDQDLLMLVNELRASGAEAISVNDERITAMSEIRCAGTMILVNWTKIGPPFVIKAIGDPVMLESGMLIKGGYLETLKFLGIQANIQKVDKLKIPASSRPMNFEFANPVKFTEEAKQ
ncbi:MAG: DUF881 domain-containing protein [Syntrophomonadaceae bacterium]|nr:DUF881 domain-containing protein [Syntrophomonadaceae bacterium]